MRGALNRSAISTTSLGLGLVLAACQSTASATPPEPIEMGGDNTYFYSASVPTYASVDGRRTIAFNALMNIYAITTIPAQGGAAQVGPTLDVDEKCGLSDYCVRMMGVALSGVPIDGRTGSYSKEWTLKSGTFRVMRCLEQDGRNCKSMLISYDGKDSVRGWYTISAKRGVEMFGRLNAAGASEDVFVLFAERGLLFKR